MKAEYPTIPAVAKESPSQGSNLLGGLNPRRSLPVQGLHLLQGKILCLREQAHPHLFSALHGGTRRGILLSALPGLLITAEAPSSLRRLLTEVHVGRSPKFLAVQIIGLSAGLLHGSEASIDLRVPDLLLDGRPFRLRVAVFMLLKSLFPQSNPLSIEGHDPLPPVVSLRPPDPSRRADPLQ